MHLISFPGSKLCLSLYSSAVMDLGFSPAAPHITALTASNISVKGVANSFPKLNLDFCNSSFNFSSSYLLLNFYYCNSLFVSFSLASCSYMFIHSLDHFSGPVTFIFLSPIKQTLDLSIVGLDFLFNYILWNSEFC